MSCSSVTWGRGQDHGQGQGQSVVEEMAAGAYLGFEAAICGRFDDRIFSHPRLVGPYQAQSRQPLWWLVRQAAIKGEDDESICGGLSPVRRLPLSCGGLKDLVQDRVSALLVLRFLYMT